MVINFCLKRNISEIHSIIYKQGTDVAYYCKGYLKEYGLYNEKDLDKALKNYNKVNVSEIPAVTNAKDRVKYKIKEHKKAKSEY